MYIVIWQSKGLSRKTKLVFSILPKNKQNSLCTEDAQDIEFCSFFGRIEDTKNCFRDLLTFNKSIKVKSSSLGSIFFSLTNEGAVRLSEVWSTY